MMFFVAWLFEMNLWGYLGLMFLGFVLDAGCVALGTVLEKIFKKIK